MYVQHCFGTHTLMFAHTLFVDNEMFQCVYLCVCAGARTRVRVCVCA